MKIFGNKKEFAIGLEYYVEKYKDDEYLKENIDEFFRGGEVYFWVKGKNLFEFKEPTTDKTYGYYNLHCLVDFLSDYLVHHLSEVPFPVKTKATNAEDMMEETALVKSDVKDELQAYSELDWSNVDRETYSKIDTWIYHRSFLANRGGTFLPNLTVRRVSDKIELSWHNRHPHDDGENKFYFLHKKGVEYIDAKLYRDVVTQFCLAYSDHIQEKYPDLAEQYRKNLQKAIHIKL